MKRILSIFLTACLVFSTLMVSAPLTSALETPALVPGTTGYFSPNYSWQRTMVKASDGRIVFFYKQGSNLYYRVYSSASGWSLNTVQVTSGGTVNTSRDVIIDTNNDIYLTYSFKPSSVSSYYAYFLKLTYNGGGWTLGTPSPFGGIKGDRGSSLAKIGNTIWFAAVGSKKDKWDYYKDAISVKYLPIGGSWSSPVLFFGPTGYPTGSGAKKLYSPRMIAYGTKPGVFFTEEVSTYSRKLCFSYRTDSFGNPWSPPSKVLGDNNLSCDTGVTSDTERLYSAVTDSSGVIHLAYCRAKNTDDPKIEGLSYAIFSESGTKGTRIDAGTSTGGWGTKYPLSPSITLVNNNPWIFYSAVRPVLGGESSYYYGVKYCASPTSTPTLLTPSNEQVNNKYVSALASNSRPYVSWSKQNGTSGVYFWTDDIPPTVDITAPLDGAAFNGGTVKVQASASDAGSGVAKVAFLVDGGLKSTDTTSPYTYSWNTAGLTGLHTITAKAYDGAGNTSSHTHTVTINQPPVAFFSWSTGSIPYPAVDWAISFIDSSTDSDGYITSWFWNFGDGGTATWQNPVHYYYATGTYNVGLTVTDNKGATNTKTIPITVVNYPSDELPVASFTYKNLGNYTVEFDGTGSYDPEGGPITYLWAFGDGGTATIAKPTHKYPGAATFTVTLGVTDNSGGHGFCTQKVIVTP